MYTSYGFLAQASMQPGSTDPVIAHTTLSRFDQGVTARRLSNYEVEARSPLSGYILARTPKSSGKFYVEVEITQIYDEDASVGLGIFRGKGDFDGFLGGGTDSWSIWNVVTTEEASPARIHNGEYSFHGTIAGSPVGRRLCLAVDFGAGKLWVGDDFDTVRTWRVPSGSPNPPTGASPSFSFVTLGDDFFLALQANSGDGLDIGNRSRLRIIPKNNWRHVAPTGFNEWVEDAFSPYTEWNPTDRSLYATISGSNLNVGRSGTVGYSTVRSIHPILVPSYWEVTVNVPSGMGWGPMALGLSQIQNAFDPDNYIGGDPYSGAVWIPQNTMLLNDAANGDFSDSATATDVIYKYHFIPLTRQLFVGTVSGGWFGGGDPDAGTGETLILPEGIYYAAFSSRIDSPAIARANFGQAMFSGAVPTTAFPGIAADPDYVTPTPADATEPRAYKFWRVKFNGAQVSTTYCSVGGVEFRGVGGANLVGLGTPLNTPSYALAYSPEKAFDNDPSTWWSSASGFPHYVGYEFPEPVILTGIAIQSVPPGAGYQDEDPKDFEIQFSPDGYRWYTAETFAGEPGWSHSEIREYAISNTLQVYQDDIVFYLSGEGPNSYAVFYDPFENEWYVNGSVRHSTAEKPYGSSAIRFDGTSDILETRNRYKHRIGRGDFVIRGKAFANALVGTQVLVAQWAEASGNVQFRIYLNGNVLTGQVYDGTTFTTVTASVVTANQWFDFAMERFNGVLTMYQEGVGGTPLALGEALIESSQKITLGGYDVSVANFTGYLKDVIFLRRAIHRGDFTPTNHPPAMMTAYLRSERFPVAVSQSSTYAAIPLATLASIRDFNGPGGSESGGCTDVSVGSFIKVDLGEPKLVTMVRLGGGSSPGFGSFMPNYCISQDMGMQWSNDDSVWFPLGNTHYQGADATNVPEYFRDIDFYMLPTVARYYRLKSNGSAYLATSTLRLFGAPAAIEKATPTYSQSSVYSGLLGTPANLNEDVFTSTTGMGTNPSANEWLMMDLGSIRVARCIAIGMGNLGGWGGVSSYIHGALLEYSVNGTNWFAETTIPNGLSDTSNPPLWVCPVNREARYWRIRKPTSSYLAATHFAAYVDVV